MMHFELNSDQYRPNHSPTKKISPPISKPKVTYILDNTLTTAKCIHITSPDLSMYEQKTWKVDMISQKVLILPQSVDFWAEEWRMSRTQHSLEIRHLTCNSSFDWSRGLTSVSHGLALSTTARESESWYEEGLMKHQFAELNETFSHVRNSSIRHLVRIENLKSR